MPRSRPSNRKLHRRKTLSEFASRLAAEWRKLDLSNSDGKVLVAVSGGADSTSLILAMHELINAGKQSIVPVVVHLDHQLRKSSKEDAQWVIDLAAKLGFKSIVSSANVKKRAKDTADNLEQAARRSRYEFFHKTAIAENAQLLVTAHTLDDQAETILMRLLRGSAAEGLSGTEAVRALEPGSSVLLARPLISWARRSDTEQYCRARKIRYRVDEMNEDERFARVKVRKQLLPLMQSFNNRVVEALARTGMLLREDALALSEQAQGLLAAATENPPQPLKDSAKRPINAGVLAASPAAIRRRALRIWIANEVGHLHRVEMVHLSAVEKLLDSNRGRTVELPGNVTVIRKRGWLYLTVKRVEKGTRKL